MAKKNKPNKIKVVIDRPSVLEPGNYKAKTIGVCIVGGKVTITIQVDQNAN